MMWWLVVVWCGCGMDGGFVVVGFARGSLCSGWWWLFLACQLLLFLYIGEREIEEEKRSHINN